jgi:hypothetical protein
MRQRSAESKQSLNSEEALQSVEIETPRQSKGDDSPDALRRKYSTLLLVALTIFLTVVILLWKTHDYRISHSIQGVQGLEDDSINQDNMVAHHWEE